MTATADVLASPRGQRHVSVADGTRNTLTLAWRSIGFLTGDDDRPALNFICGEGVPRVLPSYSEALSRTSKPATLRRARASATGASDRFRARCRAAA